MSTCSPGDTLILARNSHVSATLAMVFCGALPKYILPEHNLQWDIAGGEMETEELEWEGKKAAGVFITSPTYNVVCSNISEISQICHSHGIPVLIPGEIITKRAMDYLIQVKDKGAFLKGDADPLLSTVVFCDF
ncbi:hypothetical protein MTR67_052220 [Solanum verrucosum]|uniref:Orn/Lys/Arg decarboxylases family 1 pyridoxal-P attachment site domain-containing protein n=1 Tax=Solanum verrucosum TaxID=315347 RepID=A0AAF1A334_SOLVR|nr:hypothetical protein MTR67_052220 [Solanum verrucosum]